MHQSRDSVWETEFALVWETQLKSLNTNWEGGLRRILLQLSWFHQDWMGLISKWSAHCYHSLPFGPPLLSDFQLLVFFLFFAVGVAGLLRGRRWGDLIYIKSAWTEDNSSSDFLLIRFRHLRARGAHRPDNRKSVTATGQPVHAFVGVIVLRLHRASIWVVLIMRLHIQRTEQRHATHGRRRKKEQSAACMCNHTHNDFCRIVPLWALFLTTLCFRGHVQLALQCFIGFSFCSTLLFCALTVVSPFCPL